MAETIWVVDDEEDIVRLVCIHLQRAGFSPQGFHDGASFLKALERSLPSLVILDLMLPDMDGLDICRRIKEDKRYSLIPVIMLTARVREGDKVEGLGIGADDYVTKPFSPRELVARVKAVLRRAGASEPPVLRVGEDLVIDTERFEVTVGGLPVALTAVEFRILHLLAANSGRVFSRQRILDHLWGNEKAVLDRTVDVHIKNLRDKLGVAGGVIKNVRGVGYKLLP
jgi:two-component system phosphate regulon response regulator PhoB/two-component system alkaline phosphatase synthesis response regulator PhoP